MSLYKHRHYDHRSRDGQILHRGTTRVARPAWHHPVTTFLGLLLALLLLILGSAVQPAQAATARTPAKPYAAVETRHLVENFHTTETSHAAAVKRYANTTTLYTNGPYDNHRVIVQHDELWAPLPAGGHSTPGFAAWFLTNRIGYGTFLFKASMIAASGDPTADTGWGFVLLGWTTNNYDRGPELDLAETGSHAGKSAGKAGATYVHHHSNLDRCEYSTSGHVGWWCPDAAKANTGVSWSSFHTYSVTLTPTSTTYRVDGHVTLSTTKYPSGPTVAAGYRIRPTAQASCLAKNCKAAVIRIAKVEFIPPK